MNSNITKRKVHKLGVIIFSLLGEFIQIFTMSDQSAAISTARDKDVVMLVLNDGLDCEVRVDGEEHKGLLIHCHGEKEERGMTKFFRVCEGNWEFKFSNNETVEFRLQANPNQEQLEMIKQIRAYILLYYRLSGSAKTIGTFLQVLLLTPTEKIQSAFRRRIKQVFEQGSLLFGRRMLTLIADTLRSELYPSHKGIAHLVDYDLKA